MFSKVAIVALAAGAQVSFAAPLSQEQRSLKAIGTALVGGAASLITGEVLNHKRSESGVMVDTETGTIYADVPDTQDARSLKAIGTAVAGGIASGVAGAVVKDVFGNNKRSESSGVLVDTETGTLYMDIPDANEGRSLKAIGTAVAGGIASGVAGAVVKDVFGNNKRSVPSDLMVDTDTGIIYADIPDANEGRSLKAVGTALAGAAASYVTGQVLNNKRDSGLMVDTDTGVLYMDIPDVNEGRSLKAVGTAIAGGIASGVAGAAVKSALDNRSLSAIENFFKNLKREDDLDARSLSAIENFFSNLKREESEARSLSAIENFFKNLKRSDLAESMAKRAINDLE